MWSGDAQWADWNINYQLLRKVFKLAAGKYISCRSASNLPADSDLQCQDLVPRLTEREKYKIETLLNAELNRAGSEKFRCHFGGDQDSVFMSTGSRKLVQRPAKQLGPKITVPYSVWFKGQQVGGWTQVYADILSFGTVRAERCCI
ncbi:hypothetical protein POM88_007214 [Heracleum sosnowskyi]|uniref:Uncharacterized protein n=1 Tax=Heracleum sosnowskyi TaxID=360622 RepID=A0AAD8N693_9APIA|nr:hypothetical protein POM88_007214 [Heracleum sosnowskyi]